MELTFNGLTKNYGALCALDDFTTKLTDGVYGLLGPNGSGKTTLINILVGILNAGTGQILLNGIDIKKLGRQYLDKIGFLPQYAVFYKNFNVDEFLEYMCVLKNIPAKQKRFKIDMVLEDVNLLESRKKKIGVLSGGMRQRLGIAQAILNDPAILVLDEPTAGLDPLERIRFRNLITKISKDKLVLLATHIVSDVESIAKEIIFLRKGKLVMQGVSDALDKKILGKVWEIEASENEISSFVQAYPVANIKRLENKYHLRIISDIKPQAYAKPVEASLEDVYLWIFGSL